MHGLHQVMGLKDIFFALTLEVIFLGICTVFVGLGLSEIKKGKDRAKNYVLIALGVSLALVSIYATTLLIEG